MQKVICLYGRPASGKTTQAEKFVQEFGWQQFGMGDRLRAEINSGSELGQQIKKYVEQGILITDEIMERVIKNTKINPQTPGIIFDGFPRILSQAKMLEKIIAESEFEFVGFFYLKVEVETALKRIAIRSAVTNRSDDTNQAAVQNRLDIFAEESVPLLEFYKNKNSLKEIDGEKSIEEVYSEIKKYL
ncbi:MAG TPA: nucleoside monophosphate kinase [Candidatus Magasanikbacteria bacterium]|nr:nucleoside monophosphate kinase [Candidatus Magasanikbacteria bacterium]